MLFRVVGTECRLHKEATYNGQISHIYDLRQLEGNMSQHIVVLRELGVCRIEVEAGASAKVPISIFAVDASAAGRGVREE